MAARGVQPEEVIRAEAVPEFRGAMEILLGPSSSPRGLPAPQPEDEATSMGKGVRLEQIEKAVIKIAGVRFIDGETMELLDDGTKMPIPTSPSDVGGLLVKKLSTGLIAVKHGQKRYYLRHAYGRWYYGKVK